MNRTNPTTGSQLWENAEGSITSRHQQPQQQTREQRKSAAEQEQVLAAAVCRSAAAKENNASAFGTDGNTNDVIDTSNNNDSDSNGINDDDSGSVSASNGTFKCSNSLRNAGANSAIQRWKSNYKRLRPSY